VCVREVRERGVCASVPSSEELPLPRWQALLGMLAARRGFAIHDLERSVLCRSQRHCLYFLSFGR